MSFPFVPPSMNTFMDLATGFGSLSGVDSADDCLTRFRERASSDLTNLDKHDQLEETLDTIIKLTVKGDASAEELASHMKKATTIAKELKQQAISRLPIGAINQRCPKNASGIAQRVFNVSELLELVLAKLSIYELLNVQKVNRQFRDCVESSGTLQRHLALRPESNSGHFRAPFERGLQLPGFVASTTFIDGPYNGFGPPTLRLNDAGIIIAASFGGGGPYRAHTRVPQTVGSRIRSMFVSQPPPTTMSVRATCCSASPLRFPGQPGPALPRPDETISNGTGLTLGDLFDKAKTVIDTHRNCPNAPEFMLDKVTGEAQVTVHFVATVEVDDSDPTLDQKRRYLRQMTERDGAYRAWDQMAQAFSAAKRVAAVNGTPIPTLEEFKASQNGQSTT